MDALLGAAQPWMIALLLLLHVWCKQIKAAAAGVVVI
jgi:hypothetical protein